MSDHDYRTEHEIEYINRIGTWHKRSREIGRLGMLKLYLRSIPNRIDWNGINRQEAERHVLMLIQKEMVCAAT